MSHTRLTPSPLPDVVPFLLSFFLSWPQRPLSPVQPSWSVSANPLHPTCDCQVPVLSAQDAPDLPAASPCQPAPGTVRTVVPKPSFLADTTLFSRSSLRPTPISAGHLRPPFAHLASLALSLLTSLWPLHPSCSIPHLGLSTCRVLSSPPAWPT